MSSSDDLRTASSESPSHGRIGEASTQGLSGPTNPQATRVRRRNRMITSCLECRRRKLKCDRLHPCTNCSRGKRDCLFLAPSLDSTARLKLTELKDRMGSLERSLEEEVAAPRKPKESDHGDDSYTKLMSSSPEPEPNEVIPEDEKKLVMSKLAVVDAVYDDEADDVMLDLGIQLGRMRITDRVGGYVRPRLADELAVSLASPSGSSNNDLGNNSLANDYANLSDLLERASRGESMPFLEPGPNFIAPRSDMLLGAGAEDDTLLDVLPTRAAADKLLQQYWVSCHPVARIVHRPSFEKRYEFLWQNLVHGMEPSPSTQAVVFAAIFTAVVSMSAPEVLSVFGVERQVLLDRFQLGTETALRKAHFLRTSKTETLQAFVMYLIPMCRDTISRAHSALVGAAIRLAECMGLHRDPSDYNYGAVETHVRRLIWYQLCFLDLRTTETQGPRATIRREEYSTKFPLNANDTDLLGDNVTENPGWTDMTFARIRFECQEMMRVVFIDRIRLEKKAISITHALGKIESFRKSMHARYGPMFSKPNQTPLQRAAAVTMSLLLNRPPISLLQRYHTSVEAKLPDRLRQIILSTGAQFLEDAVTLETSPELAPWYWYSRAYHNFHAAFLLLIELLFHPLRREADRIWRCLDYVFETSATPLPENFTRQQLIEHRHEKARMIVTQLRDRMHVYRTMRKMKQTAAVTEAVIPFTLEPSNTTTETYDPQSFGHINLLPNGDIINRARQNVARQSTGEIPQNLEDVVILQEQPLTSPEENIIRVARGSSMQSEETQGKGSSAVGAPGGTEPLGNVFAGISPSSDDLPMLDIDWTEWDKMFPPHLNDGNINLPSQSMHGAISGETGIMRDAGYAPFDSSQFVPAPQPSYLYGDPGPWSEMKNANNPLT